MRVVARIGVVMAAVFLIAAWAFMRSGEMGFVEFMFVPAMVGMVVGAIL